MKLTVSDTNGTPQWAIEIIKYPAKAWRKEDRRAILEKVAAIAEKTSRLNILTGEWV